jgi:hypothetical protein
MLLSYVQAQTGASPRGGASETSESHATVWSQVFLDKTGTGCGRGLTDYVKPCPECVVWLAWPSGPLPDVRYDRPMRLSGYLVKDYAMECQILVIEDWCMCGAPEPAEADTAH